MLGDNMEEDPSLDLFGRQWEAYLGLPDDSPLHQLQCRISFMTIMLYSCCMVASFITTASVATREVEMTYSVT